MLPALVILAVVAAEEPEARRPLVPQSAEQPDGPAPSLSEGKWLHVTLDSGFEGAEVIEKNSKRVVCKERCATLLDASDRAEYFIRVPGMVDSTPFSLMQFTDKVNIDYRPKNPIAFTYGLAATIGGGVSTVGGAAVIIFWLLSSASLFGGIPIEAVFSPVTLIAFVFAVAGIPFILTGARSLLGPGREELAVYGKTFVPLTAEEQRAQVRRMAEGQEALRPRLFRYTDLSGTRHVARGLENVPEEFRSTARELPADGSAGKCSDDERAALWKGGQTESQIEAECGP